MKIVHQCFYFSSKKSNDGPEVVRKWTSRRRHNGRLNKYMSRVVRKPDLCICENKGADQLRGSKLISAFVFTIRIVQSLYFLNLKNQASSHLVWLYSPVCVGPGRKPRRPVFSERGSYMIKSKISDTKNIVVMTLKL